MRLSPVLRAFLLLGFIMHSPAQADEKTFSHDDWTAVLQKYVDQKGRVDYQTLARDRSTLDRYLEAIAQVSPASHPDLFPTRQAALAYYVNAYNALVFGGVLDRGPETVSVWRGGLISGYGFFVARKVTLGGQRTNLRNLENDVIRDQFQDPRIHAALNCASISCPRLPREAFVPERLDEQLDAVMREFVATSEVNPQQETVTVSKIFDWFEGDFLAFEKARGNSDPDILDYVNRYRQEKIPDHYKVRYAAYDKGLNQQ